jgi:hypothetical protein
MSSTPASLFSQLRGKAKTGILIEGLALAVTVLIAFMVVSFAMDRTLRLETVYRACLLAVFLFTVWHLLRRSVFKPIRFELTDDELALAMERGDDLHQSLISAVQFERVIKKGVVEHQESIELMDHVVKDVYSRVSSLRNEAALDVGRTRKFATMILGCVAVVTAWGITDSDSLLLWAKRNLFMSSEDWPRANHLVFAMETEDVVRVAEGNDLTVEVHATKEVPDQVFIEYEFPDGTTGREAMALSGETDDGAGKRFTWTLESVIFNVTLHAVGGDAKRPKLEVELVKRPVLQNVVITKTFPAYMKLDPVRISASEGDVRLPAGVTLNITGKSTKQLVDAYLTFGQEKKQSIQVDKANSTFQGTFVPERSGVLTLDVTDTDGLGAHKPPKLFLRVVKDIAPIVDYKTMGIGSMIVYKALIPGTLRIRDDFGITKVIAKIRVTGTGAVSPDAKNPTVKDPPKDDDVPWEETKFEGLREPATDENELDYDEKVVFDLLTRNDIKLGPKDPKNPIRPGMLLAIRFEATDNFGPGDKHVGLSETLTLRVVDEEKLMQDLHRRQLERRRELTQILEKEKSYKDEIKEIISPAASDSRAKLAKLRLRAIARDQLALQKQVLGVAERYKLILDEYFNNRILKPGQIVKQRQAIQLPLEKLGKEDFPTSAQEVEDFAHRGLEDQRTVALASYGAIIKIMEQVISNMRHLESVAGILEDVRRIRDMERGVESRAKRALDSEDKGAKKVETPKKIKKEGSNPAGEKGPGNGQKTPPKKKNGDKGKD